MEFFLHHLVVSQRETAIGSNVLELGPIYFATNLMEISSKGLIQGRFLQNHYGTTKKPKHNITPMMPFIHKYIYEI